MSVADKLKDIKKLKEKRVEKKVYRDLDKIPTGRASDHITEGCLVLEGGAWKGLYTVGVLDALMVHDINFRTTVGISAGGLAGLGYVAGQIGVSANIDLKYRHDPKYCGIKAYKENHGITGFTYLYHDLFKSSHVDIKRVKETPRRLVVGATNMNTGKIEYFEKGSCNLSAAIRASATVPYVSRPVVIKGVPYLDGGCATRIPYAWAKEESGEGKIIVVKTREREFKRSGKIPRLTRYLYKDYPLLIESLERANDDFNALNEEMYAEEAKGNIFIMAPSKKVEVTRFEGDMDKLGDLYWLGYHDMEERLPALLEYLKAGKE